MKIIAVVDDKSYIRDALRMALSERLPGTEIFTFPGGVEVLKAISSGEMFDLVFMDGKLSDGYTGPMYTAVILERRPETIVVGLSTDESLGQQFIDNGAKLFMTKSFKLAELEGIIKNLLSI